MSTYVIVMRFDENQRRDFIRVAAQAGLTQERMTRAELVQHDIFSTRVTYEIRDGKQDNTTITIERVTEEQKERWAQEDSKDE